MNKNDLSVMMKMAKENSRLSSPVNKKITYEHQICAVAPIAVQTINKPILFRRFFFQPLNVIFNGAMTEIRIRIVYRIQVT